MKAYVKRLLHLQDGSFVCSYNSRTYLATKSSYAKGRVLKFYAKELGGRDFVSLNLFLTKQSPLLRPCEMSPQKVIDFLEHFEPTQV